ncbi:MAG TPA: peptide ABC transporter substrate-binding protein [Candidatus Paceibacterota bacterium]|nr:peptide ABC transporter substrate-binding protein [Candidatus Paceibacterota bacterium]
MSFFKKLFFAFTGKERIAFLACSAIAVASFAIVMSMVVAQATVSVPTQGGTYTEGMVGQPEYVNPVTAQSEADLSLVKLVYANLTDLADDITTSTDGRTWTVHLKNGLTWQDGQKLTSDDVIFTVQSIQAADANSPLYTSWEGVTASRVSELEVQFTLANPYAFFGDDLDDLYIIPKHIFADVPPGNWYLSDYNLKPVGSGPYEFTAYDEQDDGFISGYHLTAWSGYAGRQPLIQNFNVQFFRNEADLVASFNAGQVDGFGNLSAGDLAEISRPYNLFAWRTPGYYAIFWNESKNIALQDPAVRQALSEAVDRDALVSQALAGYGAADDGPIPPDAPYFVPTGESSSPDLASETLSQDGWTISSSSPFRSKTIQKTSVPLAVNLTVPDINFLVTTAGILQGAWQSIGVQVNIATDTPADLVANAIKNRAYESLLFGNVLGPSSDLYSFWDSSQRFSPGLNLAIYQNKAVDSLIEAARQELDDASRTQEFAAAEQDIVNDDPAVFLYSPDYLYISSRDVQGVATGTLVDPSDLSREMTGWYLDTARVLK